MKVVVLGLMTNSYSVTSQLIMLTSIDCRNFMEPKGCNNLLQQIAKLLLLSFGLKDQA